MSDNTPQLYDHEAEKALLGGILTNPAGYSVIKDVLGDDPGEAFFVHRHKRIWQAFEQLNEKGDPIDILTMSERLEKNGYLKDVGGPAYLTELLIAVPSSLHTEAYAKEIREHYDRRMLMQEANAILKLAHDKTLPVSEGLAEIVERLDRLGTSGASNLSFHILDAGLEYLSMLDGIIKSGSNMLGYSTGYKALDYATKGIRPRIVTVLAGRPSMGKSSLALQSAFRQARQHDLKIGIFSMEDPKEVCAENISCAVLGVDSHNYREDDYERVMKFVGEVLADTNIRICETPGLTPAEIGREMARMKKEMGQLDVVWIDQLGYVEWPGKVENENIKYGRIMKALGKLPRRFDCGMVVLHQMSRQVTHRSDKDPELTDLRESGHIEQDARAVWFINRPSYWQPIDDQPAIQLAQELRVIVRKNFRGPANVHATLAFVPKYGRITDYTGQTLPMPPKDVSGYMP